MSLLWTQAQAFPPCSKLLMTMGVELEFASPRVLLSMVRQRGPRLPGSTSAQDLVYGDTERSQLREAYRIYGWDESRQSWVMNWVPPEIARTLNVSERPASLQSTTGSDLSLTLRNFEKLSGKDWWDSVGWLLQADLQGRRVQLRKNPGFWKGKIWNFGSASSHPLDDVFEEHVLAESRNGVFVNLEWRSARPLASKAEVKAFHAHWRTRLGLMPENAADRETVLKVDSFQLNGVIDLSSASPETREKAGQAILGFWGDINDQLLIEEHRLASGATRGERLVMDEKILYRAWHSTYLPQENKTTKPLFRKTWQRAHAHADGVSVDRRETGLDPSQEAYFPKVFKLLPVGLRSLPSSLKTSGAGALQVLRLETRSRGKEFDPFSLLPKSSEAGVVDLSELVKHESREPRGLSSRAELEVQARKYGLESSGLQEALSIVKEALRGDIFWSDDEFLSWLFLPFTPWDRHPLYVHRLSELPEAWALTQRLNYDTALATYVSTVRQLMRARNEPAARFTPDWDFRWDEPLTPNRLHRDMKTQSFFGQDHFTSNPDILFTMAIVAAKLRFVIDSGLSELMALQMTVPRI